MIRLHVKQGLLGDGCVQTVDLQWRRGMRAEELREVARPMLPQSIEAIVIVNGERVPDGADRALHDGDQVIITADALDPVSIIGVATSIFVRYQIERGLRWATNKIVPRPDPDGTPADRGDQQSPTYAWDGIQTSFGQGFLVPFAYGRIATGGQLIYQDVETNNGVPLEDVLRTIVAFGEGPIRRIGDKIAAEQDALGGLSGHPSGGAIPGQIRINGNLLDKTNLTPGARVWLRSGQREQSALPAPFIGVSQTFEPSTPRLDDAGQEAVFTFSDTSTVASVSFLMSFPGGLYQQQASGIPGNYQVLMSMWWRPVGETTWRTLGGFTFNGASLTPLVFTQVGNFIPGPQTGPMEIRVLRTSAAGGSQVVSQCTWRNVVFHRPLTLQYPRIALMGLELEAGARFSGGQPNVVTRLDGLLIRVWDASLGFSPRCWDVPAAPFNWMTNAPGRNNAWVLLDFLTSPWGLGRFLKDSDIDLPAIRRWSIQCDRDPNPSAPWGEPSFTCDFVGDAPRPAWEWVLMICAAGRAAPCVRNGKISVVYQYRDSHADSLVSVPAKTSTQLLSSSNCQDVQVDWLPKANRTTAFLYQFLSEDEQYQQSVLPVEDLESTINDPTALLRETYKPETIQAFAEVRPAQLFRDGIFRHRINRLVRRALKFTTGRWALAAEVGDLFDFESEVIRPFAANVPASGVVLVGGTATTTITVDHAVSGGGLQCVVRDPDGKPQVRTVSGTAASGSGTILTLTAAVTCTAGAPAVVGLASKLTEPYLLISATLGKDQKRKCEALQWVPAVHDVIDKALWLGSGNTDEIQQPPDDSPPAAPEVVDVVAAVGGGHRIAWDGGQPATIWIREAGAAWSLVGRSGTGDLDHAGLQPHRDYEVAVVPDTVDGAPRLPEDGTVSTFRAPEFPAISPPAVTNVRSAVLEAALLVEWDDIDQLDLRYYEIRAGSDWLGGRVLLRTREPFAMLTSPPGVSLLIAARSTSGLYGNPVLHTPSAWTPPGTASVLSVDDLPSPGGTLTGLEIDIDLPAMQLVSNALTGSYVSAVQDVGYQAPIYWRVAIDRTERERTTVGELTWTCGSGEARWRHVGGRPASPARAGSDWQRTVADCTTMLDDLPASRLCGVDAGEAGSFTRVLVESRFEVGGSWTAYREHRDRVVVARKMQVRLRLDRLSYRYEVRVTTLRYEGFL